MRNGDDDRVGVDVFAVHHDAGCRPLSSPGGEVDCVDLRPLVDAPPETAQQCRGGIDVERVERHARPTDIGSIGAVEESRPENLGPKRK